MLVSDKIILNGGWTDQAGISGKLVMIQNFKVNPSSRFDLLEKSKIIEVFSLLATSPYHL